MKVHIKRLAGTSLTYGVGQMLNRFLTFLLLPVFTYFLTPADYGISSILQVFVLLIMPVFSLGLTVAMGVCYFDEGGRERKEATIWTSVALLSLSTIALAILGTVFSARISEFLFGHSRYQYLVVLSVLTMCLIILSQPLTLFLQFENRAKVFVALTLASTLATVGFNVLMVVILRKGIQGLIEAGFIAQLIMLPLYFVPMARSLKFRLSRRVGNELLRQSLPAIPSLGFLLVLQQANKYILQDHEGLDAVGVYTIGFNFGMVMSLIVSGFTAAWHPFFLSFTNKQDEARPLFGRVMTYYVLGAGALSLLFFAVARPVVTIMTRPSFHESYLVVGLSACAQFLIGVFSLLLAGMYFAKEVKYLSVVQAFAAGAAIALNFILIPPFGILGAAIALAFGYLLMAVLQHLWNRRRNYLDIQYEWGRIARFALFYVIYAVVMLWDRSLPLIGELVISAVAVLVVPLPLYLLLSEPEKRFLLTTIKRFTPRFFYQNA